MATAKSAKKHAARNDAHDSVATEVLTLAEAAAFLRVPKDDVLDLVRTQALPARKIGGDWRLLKAAIEDWLRTVPSRGKGLLGHLGALHDDPNAEEMLRDIYDRRGRPMTEER